MSFKFGFYNSLNGDRKYDAIQFGQLFDGIINDGVFMSIGGKLMVTASEGMSVAVATGRAWFDSTWSFNDSIMVLDLDDAEVILNRIDVVVLEVNADDASRTNSIKIIKGTPATEPLAPELTDTGKLHQHPLAYVYVAANATEITQSNITNKVGTSECPFVTGILETMDIDDLIAQWGTEWDEFMSSSDNEWTTWLESVQSDTEEFQNEQETSFNTWFDGMKDQLTEDAAGNLQIQINDLHETIVSSTMTAASWTEDKKYSFESTYPFATYNLYIAIADTATSDEYDAFNAAGIVGSGSTNVVVAYGDVPTIDIPILIRVVKK